MRGASARRRQSGVSMVEFALVAPVAFTLLLGLPVLAILVMGQIQLTNAVRDGIRAAAICGSDPQQSNTLPDGTTACTASGANPGTNVKAYVDSRFDALQGSSDNAVIIYMNIYDKTDATHTVKGTYPATMCQRGQVIEVEAQYSQPLYVPFIGRLLGGSAYNQASNTRTITDKAQAVCEQ
jgi:Flp pilus assembly protein TadG